MNKLVTFECAPSFSGPSLSGLIHINPEHVTAVKHLAENNATAIFVSNFQILVSESEASVISRLGFNLEEPQQKENINGIQKGDGQRPKEGL